MHCHFRFASRAHFYHHRYTILEFLVPRLVMPHFHATPSPDTSAKDGKQEQGRLRDAPLGVLRLVLVNAIDYERYGIDGEEVNEDCFLHCLCPIVLASLGHPALTERPLSFPKPCVACRFATSKHSL